MFPGCFTTRLSLLGKSICNDRQNVRESNEMKCSKIIYIDHARTRACALSTELSLQNVGTMSSSAVNRCSAPVQKYARFVSRARVVSESVEQHAVRKTMQEERRRRFAVHQYGSILHVVARVPRLNSTLLHDIGSEPRLNYVSFSPRFNGSGRFLDLHTNCKNYSS